MRFGFLRRFLGQPAGSACVDSGFDYDAFSDMEHIGDADMEFTVRLKDTGYFDSLAFDFILQELMEKAAKASIEVDEMGCPNSRAHRDIYRAIADGMVLAKAKAHGR